MIKQIQTAHTIQTPVALTPKIARNPAYSSFNQQLSGALATYQAGRSKASASINPGLAARSTMGTSQKNGISAPARQILAAVTTGPVPPGVKPYSRPVVSSTLPTLPAAAPAPMSSPATTTSPIEYTPDGKPLPPSLGFMHIIQPTLVAPASTKATVPTTEADRYWAQQPKAVQELRKIDDPTERKLKAWDLANQGYTIDVPIMVWEWDPQYTMDLRKSYGYTWVPSALQDTVKIAPGLQMPGVTSYDPNRPPPGSILVNTDFV